MTEHNNPSPQPNVRVSLYDAAHDAEIALRAVLDKPGALDRHGHAQHFLKRLQEALAAYSAPQPNVVAEDLLRRVLQLIQTRGDLQRFYDKITGLEAWDTTPPPQTRAVACPSCDGTGTDLYDGTPHDCQVCAGRGAS